MILAGDNFNFDPFQNSVANAFGVTYSVGDAPGTLNNTHDIMTGSTYGIGAVAAYAQDAFVSQMTLVAGSV
jgi:hypothetical protein